MKLLAAGGAAKLGAELGRRSQWRTARVGCRRSGFLAEIRAQWKQVASLPLPAIAVSAPP